MANNPAYPTQFLTAEERRQRVDAFHELAWEAGKLTPTSWAATRYFGYPIWKWPADLWLYHDVITNLRPTLIIETGTGLGGSALYFAHILEQLRIVDISPGSPWGGVVTIDIEAPTDLPSHPLLRCIESSSTAPRMRTIVSLLKPHHERVLVSLDSDHSCQHVLEELELYGSLASYIVVEDTDVNGHPVYPEHGPGPHEAIARWLPEHPEFEVDVERSERYLMSFSTWLKRTRALEHATTGAAEQESNGAGEQRSNGASVEVLS